MNNENKKKSSRCFFCNKKIKLIISKCRCENLYCIEHLLPEKHNCTFDYKNNGKEKLKLLNPKIETPKIVKI